MADDMPFSSTRMSAASSSSIYLRSHEDQPLHSPKREPDNLKRLLQVLETKRSARSMVIPQDDPRTPSATACSQPERTDSRSSTRQTDRRPSNKSATSCGHCRASIGTELHATAFQRTHRLCHCCKLSMASINRSVVNHHGMLLRLRFCVPCLEENEDEFIEHARAAQPPSHMTCSGCLKTKYRKCFHKRQRIFWQWEEPLDQKYYCSICQPSGFAPEEKRIIPKKLTCTQCAKVRHCEAFTRSLKEQSYSSEDLEQFTQCVKDSLVVCNYCLNNQQRLDDRMLCCKCDRLLNRSKFSDIQQTIAKKEDGNPGHLGFDPDYVCYFCWVSAIEESKRKRHREPATRQREDRGARSPSQAHHKRRRDGSPHARSVERPSRKEERRDSTRIDRRERCEDREANRGTRVDYDNQQVRHLSAHFDEYQRNYHEQSKRPRYGSQPR